jgi:hypothetical protein
MSVTETPRETRRRSALAGARRRVHPREAGPADESLLPPGRRDRDGFWYPDGYPDPESLFSPHQRRLQEKQRQAHRDRRGRAHGEGARLVTPAGHRAGNASVARAARVDSPTASD